MRLRFPAASWLLVLSAANLTWAQNPQVSDNARETVGFPMIPSGISRPLETADGYFINAPISDEDKAASPGDKSSGGEKESGVGVKPISEADVEKIVAEYLKKQAKQKEEDEKEKAALAKAQGYEVGSDLAMSATWKDGLELSTKNKDFKVHVGGRFQFDTGWYSIDPAVNDNLNGAAGGNLNSPRYADGVDFRRARFRIDGTMYELIDWATEIDFVNSFRANNTLAPDPNSNRGIDNTTVALTDFWWQLRSVPFFGNVRIGQQKEPIGFEHIVSSRFLPFLERSFNQDTFYGGTFNGFSPGISAWRNFGEDDRGLIQYGLFKPIDNNFGYNTGDGDYALVGRLSKAIWYVDEGRGLLHVGLSGRQATAVSQNQSDRRIDYRTRDAFRTGLSQDWAVPAGIRLFGDDTQSVNAELASVYGPWTFQSEYLVNTLQDARINTGDSRGNTVVYHGGYVQLLYFLTGESDQYSKERGAFDRVRPRENFFVTRAGKGYTIAGMGAWQVGARYNYLDLNDTGFNNGALQTFNGGILHNMTFGLNWFWNPNMKAQFNYIATYRDATEINTVAWQDGSGWIHGFGTRIACDF